MIGALQVGFLAAEWVLLILGLCIVGIVALVVGALWMYRDAQSRGMDAGLWVVILIVATFLGAGIVGFVIVFVIYLLVREDHPVGSGYFVPAGYGPYPPGQAPPASACPVCGRPMTWYPQYQRWYCPSCGQYR